MKKIVSILMCLLVISGSNAFAASKNDNKMKSAEQAFKEKRYADAKAIFDKLKDKPKYREKSYLYLAMTYYETGWIENALEGLRNFKRYNTDKTDLTLITAAENLKKEISNNFNTLDIAIFSKDGKEGVDPGYYNLLFTAESGLNPAQQARLGIINKVIGQSQGIINWKSDGTFLRGTISYFPIKMYDTTPFTAEVNGVPIFFRYDFQTLQGLWIPYDILENTTAPPPPAAFNDSFDKVYNRGQTTGAGKSKYIIMGAAAGVVVTAIIAIAVH